MQSALTAAGFDAAAVADAIQVLCGVPPARGRFAIIETSMPADTRGIEF